MTAEPKKPPSKPRSKKSGAAAKRPPAPRTKRVFSGADHLIVQTMAERGLSFERICQAMSVSYDQLQDVFWRELVNARRVAGKKPLFFPEEKRQTVRLMAAAGITMQQVADSYGVSRESIYRHFSDEWKTAPLELVVRIANALVKNALNGDGPSQRFILERRGFGAWVERSQIEHVVETRSTDFVLEDVSDTDLEQMREFARRQMERDEAKQQLLTVEDAADPAAEPVGLDSDAGASADTEDVPGPGPAPPGD